MSKPSAKRRTVAAISFGDYSLLKRALIRAEKLHGRRGLSRYVRDVVKRDLEAATL